MGLIPEEQKQHLKAEFNEKLTNKVKLVMFTQENECPLCKETRELVEELGGLSDKIEVSVYDFGKDTEQAAVFGIDKVPAIVVWGEKDYGIRYYGLPFGYEFQTLFESLVNVSRRDSGLSEDTKAKIKAVDKPVHIQVFVTLTCPYCPIIASLAHRFAMESDLITAEVVDANEFPQVATRFNVFGVPKTVINEKVEFISVVAENVFIEHILAALKT